MGGNKRGNTLGIIGGLGPLASAEFLKTIYEQCKGMKEQCMPKVYMYSDPSFPERSEIQSDNYVNNICFRLEKGLDELSRLNVSQVVICCITLHHLLPKLSSARRKKITSLLDLIFNELVPLPKQHVVLCSTRTSNVKLFQRHPGWLAVPQFLIFPDKNDQKQVQGLILKLKSNGGFNSSKTLLDRFARKYGTRRFICGCTEMHLLAKWFQSTSNLKSHYKFLDPLMIFAKSLSQNCKP